MSISVSEAQKMIDELKNHEISLGRNPKTWYTYNNHVYGVAEIARKIATKISTMNPNTIYVMALLHDICRTEDVRLKRFHGLLGYEKLISLDENVARACLLHTFPWNNLPPYNQCGGLFFYQKKDYQFVADFLKKNPPKQEDYLIQLCDALANRNGFVTIEERAEEIRQRHIKQNIPGFMDVSTTNKLKQHFDQKIGCDIYDLFKQIPLQTT